MLKQSYSNIRYFGIRFLNRMQSSDMGEKSRNKGDQVNMQQLQLHVKGRERRKRTKENGGKQTILHSYLTGGEKYDRLSAN